MRNEPQVSPSSCCSEATIPNSPAPQERPDRTSTTHYKVSSSSSSTASSSSSVSHVNSHTPLPETYPDPFHRVHQDLNSSNRFFLFTFSFHVYTQYLCSGFVLDCGNSLLAALPPPNNWRHHCWIKISHEHNPPVILSNKNFPVSPLNNRTMSNY